MANERQMLTQVIQVGVESTPGTAVAATKRFQSCMVVPTINADVAMYTASGFKVPTTSSLNTENVTAALTGMPTFGELCYLLSSGLVKPSSPSPIGQGYKWTFEPVATAVEAYQSLTVEHGSAERADRFAWGIVDSLGLVFSRRAIGQITGSMLGQALEDNHALTTLTAVNDVQTLSTSGTVTSGTFILHFRGQDTTAIPFGATATQVGAALAALSTVGVGNVVCTGGPLPATPVIATFGGNLGNQTLPILTVTDTLTGGSTVITHTTPGVSIYAEPTPQPITPTMLDLYVDTSAGALGSTAMTKGFRWSFNWGARYLPMFAFGSGQTGFTNTTEQEGKPTCKFLIEMDTQGGSMLTHLRANDTLYVRLKATGPALVPGDTNKYSMTFDTAVKLSKPSPFQDEGQRVVAIEFTGEVVQDNSWGKSVSCVIQNMLAAL